MQAIGAAGAANYSGSVVVTIPFYATVFKTAYAFGGSQSSNSQTSTQSGFYRWFDTSAVTSVTLFMPAGVTFLAGSEFQAYGY